MAVFEIVKVAFAFVARRSDDEGIPITMVKPQLVTIAASSAKAASEEHTDRCAAANLAVARLRGPCPFRCLRSDDEYPQ